MPGSVANCVIPTVSGHPLVFPFSLCVAFHVERAFAARTNEYRDGTLQRTALVAAERRTWKTVERLTATQASALWAFMATYPTTAFYFYDLIEGAHDATGAAATGRYAARLNGDLSQQMDMARVNMPVELIEIV